jgi:SpoVK/Ycf46/Vps4 family AAA+-type ATPase
VPTIVINHPWIGDKFNTLIQSIQQPCIVMFDEFEKVYNNEEQEELLTLLDGIYSSKKLFMLTSNDKWRVDSHMRNRPGRIFYMVDFKGLDETFIREYCYDNLAKPELKTIDTIVNISSVFSAFNFDMLKALVEEMNRYDESPQEAMRILNVRAEFDSAVTYRIELYKGDRKSERGTTSWTGAPLSAKEICVNYYFKAVKKTESKSEFKTLLFEPSPVDDDDDGDGWGDIDFTQDDLVKFNNKTGQFIFEKNGLTMILVKDTPKHFNFDAF